MTIRRWPKAHKAKDAGLGRTLAVVLVIAVLAVYALAQAPVQTGSAGGGQLTAAISWPLFIVALIVVLLLNAFLSAGEAACDLLRPMHVKHFRDRNDRLAARLQILLDDKETFAAACKLGSDLARLCLFLLVLAVSPEVTRAVGYASFYPQVLLTAVLIMIPVGLINLVFEMVPRSYASLHPHIVSVRLYGFIRIVSVLLSIPAKLATGLANLITTRFGGQAGFAIANQAEEEIKTIAASAEETGEIEVDERQLLHSVFEFGDTVAREVMTPRVDIDGVPVSSSADEVVALIRESGHSRIPLYEQTDDQIVGIIHAKDLFMATMNGQPVVLRNLMRPATFVPENKNLYELLTEMRATRNQMVIVQDEFGGTSGIVTIEDIVEELVGDIVDEYDVEEPEISATPEGWIVDGKTHIDDLNEEVDSDFESGEFDTVGGLVFGLFGRQPKDGESIESQGYLFTVAETDGRRILKLKVEKLPEHTELSEHGGEEQEA